MIQINKQTLLKTTRLWVADIKVQLKKNVLLFTKGNFKRDLHLLLGFFRFFKYSSRCSTSASFDGWMILHSSTTFLAREEISVLEFRLLSRMLRNEHRHTKKVEWNVINRLENIQSVCIHTQLISAYIFWHSFFSSCLALPDSPKMDASTS